MPSNKSVYIKVRKRGDKAYWFLSGRGGMNRLRIHAAMFDTADRAKQVLTQLLQDNPDIEGKLVTQ